MRITSFVARVSWWTGVVHFFYFLNRRRKRIITFHNVLRDVLWREGMANGVSCNESEFREIVKECGRRFGFSTDLFDASTLTITFDDGYQNQYSTAFRVLRELNIPAYVFVSGGLDDKPLVIDRLLVWVAEVPDGRYVFDFNARHHELVLEDKASRREAWIKTLWHLFIDDNDTKGNGLLATLDALFPLTEIRHRLPPDYWTERCTGISEDELSEMRSAGWKVGWHTANHYPLGRLSDEEVKEELGAPPIFMDVCFSFPYGGDQTVDDRSLEAVKRAGFPCAVSNTTVSRNNSSRWFMPRMQLVADRYLLHFQLSGLHHFLKYRKLLPMIDGFQ